MQGRAPDTAQLRHFIEIEPVLDFAALEPGRKASDAIRRAAADLKLDEKYGAQVALTGRVPMNDDQFSVIQSSALRDTLIAIAGVLVILWLALRSLRLRHDHDDLREALRRAARKAGAPLALAAAATAAAFFSFLPTDYRGLSELGLIAFFCSLTLVPAMLAVLDPPGEPSPVGFARLAPLDRFLQRHRIAFVAATLLVVLAGAPLLWRVPFDFNPVNLQNPRTQSVATYRELQREPEAAVNSAEVIAPSLDAAQASAQRLAAVPEVARALTLATFIPDDQERKIAAIRRAARPIGAALNPRRVEPAPSDQQTVAAIRDTAAKLAAAAADASGKGADAARNVAQLLERLAQSDAAVRRKAEAAVVAPLRYDLEALKLSLDPQPIAVDTMPGELKRGWLAPDGRARVEVLPRGDPNDTGTLQRFATAVLAAEPAATGPAISYYEFGRTIVAAFLTAGAVALAVIAVLLFIMLRRAVDVLLTLVPLLLAGAVTLEIAVLTGLALNFANIIALPLLLGVGVAFKIYYIMAWRAGKTALLSIDADPRRDLQRADQCGRVRQHVGLRLSGDVEHGRADDPLARLHDVRRGAVPAMLMGAPRQIQQH